MKRKNVRMGGQDRSQSCTRRQRHPERAPSGTLKPHLTDRQVDVEKDANRVVEIVAVCEGLRGRKRQAGAAEPAAAATRHLPHSRRYIDDKNKVLIWHAQARQVMRPPGTTREELLEVVGQAADTGPKTRTARQRSKVPLGWDLHLLVTLCSWSYRARAATAGRRRRDGFDWCAIATFELSPDASERDGGGRRPIRSDIRKCGASEDTECLARAAARKHKRSRATTRPDEDVPSYASSVQPINGAPG